MSRYELRPYQQDGITRVLQAIAGGKKAPLLVAPTGTGKMVETRAQTWYSRNSCAPAVLVTPRSATPLGRGKLNTNTRQCAKCREVKALDLFPRDRCEPSGFSYSCKPCKAAQKKARRAVDPAKVREKERAYEARKAQDIREKKAAYYQENRATILARHVQNRSLRLIQMREYGQKNRGKINARIRATRAANPGKFRAYWHNVRARRRAAPGTYCYADVKVQLASQQGQCYWCQCVLGKFHVDHLIPLNKGGTNYPNNIVIACVSCNTSRQDLLPHEWNGRLL